MKKIVFLSSGNGGNLKFFFLAQRHQLTSEFELHVIADRECGSVKFAKNYQIPCEVLHYTRSDTSALNEALDAINPDIIVTNWHKIIDKNTVEKFSGKFINLHYSLLPAFSGLIGIEPLKKAYEQGCKWIGPTCHIVDEGVDTGRIISQSIFETNTPLQAAVEKMFRIGCLTLLNGMLTHCKKDQMLMSISKHDDCLFSPPLLFDVNLFTESFWSELSML